MRRLLIAFLFFFSVYNWFYYTSTGDFPREELRQARQVSIEEILTQPDLRDLPVLTRGLSTSSLSTNWGGFCTLRSEGRTILILSRGFTPATGSRVRCIMVPRQALGIGSRSIIVAALIGFQEEEVHSP